MSEWKPIDELFDYEKGTMQSSKCSPGQYSFITAAEEWKTHKIYTHDCEALIFAMAASGSLGRTHYVKGKFISSDLCFILTPKKGLRLDLMFYHRLFNYLRTDIVKRTATGTSKLAINQTNFGMYKLPYFDYEHQVAFRGKIEKITLINDEFSGGMSEQLMFLQKLRQSILQEAIEGKLTTEWRKKNPKLVSGDNHASRLLERIRAEKGRLVKEGKIREGKLLPLITDEEKAFVLPEGWVWCRFQELTKVITCGMASTPKYYSNGRIFLSAKNVKPYRFMPEDHKFVDEVTYKRVTQNAKPEKGDILMTRVGAGIGESAIIDRDIDFAYYVSLTLIKLFPDILSSQYVLHFLNSLHGIANAISYTTGVGSSQGNLNVNKVRPYVIPLPPIAEQQVIVDQVDGYMGIIDNLEQQVTDRKRQSEMLLQSVLRESFI